MTKTVITITLAFISISFSHAQEPEDLDIFRSLLPVEQSKEPIYKEYAKQNASEFEWLASNLFLAYKTFISSQDGYRCSFHPSCSEYAIISIKRKGLLIGGMSTFDRLGRCNSLSPEWYKKDHKRKLLIDHP